MFRLFFIIELLKRAFSDSEAKIFLRKTQHFGIIITKIIIIQYYRKCGQKIIQKFPKPNYSSVKTNLRVSCGSPTV